MLTMPLVIPGWSRSGGLVSWRHFLHALAARNLPRLIAASAGSLRSGGQQFVWRLLALANRVVAGQFVSLHSAAPPMTICKIAARSRFVSFPARRKYVKDDVSMSHSPHRKRSAASPAKLTAKEQLRAAARSCASKPRRSGIFRIGSTESFCQTVQMIFACKGSVIVTGMGKAGIVGQKIAATLASLGTRAHFLHPAEAFHGDLGRIHASDVVLMLTQSGETGEVVQLLPSLKEFEVPLVAITAAKTSTVGRAASDRHRAGPIGRSLFARPRAEHEHDGDAGASATRSRWC